MWKVSSQPGSVKLPTTATLSPSRMTACDSCSEVIAGATFSTRRFRLRSATPVSSSTTRTRTLLTSKGVRLGLSSSICFVSVKLPLPLLNEPTAASGWRRRRRCPSRPRR